VRSAQRYLSLPIHLRTASDRIRARETMSTANRAVFFAKLFAIEEPQAAAVRLIGSPTMLGP
jgi:hypothetical protein